MESTVKPGLNIIGIAKVLVAGLAMVWCLAAMITSSREMQDPTPAPARATDSWHGMPEYASHPEESAAKMKKLMTRTKGDYNKLTGDEKKWVDSVSGDRGRAMFSRAAPAGPPAFTR